MRATEKALVPVDADRLWHEVGSFGALGEWHPLLAKVESEGDRVGAARIAHTKDGLTQVERLRHLDDRSRVYRYALESSSLPVRGYFGEFRVDDNGDNTSTVVWSARFEGDEEAARAVQGFLKAGVEGLRERYGRRH